MTHPPIVAAWPTAGRPDGRSFHAAYAWPAVASIGLNAGCTRRATTAAAGIAAVHVTSRKARARSRPSGFITGHRTSAPVQSSNAACPAGVHAACPSAVDPKESRACWAGAARPHFSQPFPRGLLASGSARVRPGTHTASCTSRRRLPPRPPRTRAARSRRVPAAAGGAQARARHRPSEEG